MSSNPFATATPLGRNIPRIEPKSLELSRCAIDEDADEDDDEAASDMEGMPLAASELCRRACASREALETDELTIDVDNDDGNLVGGIGAVVPDAAIGSDDPIDPDRDANECDVSVEE